MQKEQQLTKKEQQLLKPLLSGLFSRKPSRNNNHCRLYVVPFSRESGNNNSLHFGSVRGCRQRGTSQRKKEQQAPRRSQLFDYAQLLTLARCNELAYQKCDRNQPSPNSLAFRSATRPTATTYAICSASLALYFGESGKAIATFRAVLSAIALAIFGGGSLSCTSSFSVRPDTAGNRLNRRSGLPALGGNDRARGRARATRGRDFQKPRPLPKLLLSLRSSVSFLSVGREGETFAYSPEYRGWCRAI